MLVDQWVFCNSALRPIIDNTERHLLCFFNPCISLLETIDLRVAKFIQGTTGFTYEDIPKPKWELSDNRPDSSDDRP